MRAVVISGGSGNDALLKGLYAMYPQINLSIIVNAYDDGKSTGVCRMITDTLGVSDIRKNHSRLYQISHFKSLNGNVVQFFDARFDLPKGNELNFVCKKLSEWELDFFAPYACSFFANEKALDFEYTNFSIANIVYSAMYQVMGYTKANDMICEKFDIPNVVLLNSFENVTLGAQTNKGVLYNEASIVDLANEDKKIESLIYDSETPVAINPVVIDTLENADMIIISCGTFWSSILPTLEYGGLYRAINKAKGFKLWVMNNEQDKDSYGVGSNEFLKVTSDLGLDLSKFVILENNDAHETLREKSEDYDIAYYNMGNVRGKHLPMELAKAIFKEYFGLRECRYEHILMDFDNTISSKNVADTHIVVENLMEIAARPNIQIVSGNDYKTAILPVIKQCGLDLPNNVWADASSVLYVGDNKKFVVKKHLINKNAIKFLAKYIYGNFGVVGDVNNDDYISCYKIKPLSALERSLLIKHLNGYVFKAYGIKGLKAIPAGRTTVDIVAKKNSKANIFVAYKLDPNKCLYIGDETEDYGNDYEIAHACAHYVRVANVYETNIVLKVMK